jgi:hypothetical protein
LLGIFGYLKSTKGCLSNIGLFLGLDPKIARYFGAAYACDRCYEAMVDRVFDSADYLEHRRSSLHGFPLEDGPVRVAEMFGRVRQHHIGEIRVAIQSDTLGRFILSNANTPALRSGPSVYLLIHLLNSITSWPMDPQLVAEAAGIALNTLAGFDFGKYLPIVGIFRAD